MRRFLPSVSLLACLVLVATAVSARAATLAPVGTFEAPMFVTSDPSDPNRLLVAEREGRVVLAVGTTRTLLADLETWVQCCEGERGLLSIAPAPDFATSGRFYAAYTGNAVAGGAVGDIHVDAFTVVQGGGPVPLREPLAAIPHSTSATHNGGQLQLGPDGFLYLSTGDGGGVGDPDENAQDPSSMLGKILRIDPDPAGGPAQIWASGLRNPWRFSFDRATGTMVIGDVGQSLREEIDIGVEGANYGWNCREGFIAYPGAPPSCAALTGFTDPVFDYPHEGSDGGIDPCSITGGYVVRDLGLGDLYGRYLYTDFCAGELRSLVLPSTPGGLASGDRSEGISVSDPVSFGEDACGRIYVASQGGTVYRLQGNLGGGCFFPPPAPPPPSVAVTAVQRPRPLVILQARKRGRRTVKLIVRLLPCADRGGDLIYLNRNGRLFRQKRLDRRCVARFRIRVRGRTRFRAFYEDQRSQVRTIAFAKPRP
ncbi:MAG TPA: PQQ-dependent sugar dehydrogenase [Solirubrobacterales bacterium]